MNYAYLAVSLPDGFYFLQTGWWVLHAAVITFVFLTGYLVGSRRPGRQTREPGYQEVRNMVQIPDTFRFLGPGWWVLHLIAIPLVFFLGHVFWP